MSSWPALDRAPVRLPTLPGHDDELWAALVELSELRPGEWTLVGGQMVFLHAIEHGVSPPRVSTGLDVLVNARIVTAGSPSGAGSGSSAASSSGAASAPSAASSFSAGWSLWVDWSSCAASSF